MIYFIACLSSFLSGMGIGGGSSFIILSLLFELLNIDQARTYNLILFISVGIFIIFKNLKNKKIFDKKYFKSLFFIIIGCILGMILNKYINSKVRTNSKKAWADIIEYVLKDVDTSWYETPKNVVAIPLDAVTGKTTNDSKKAALYYYVKGSEPGVSKEQYVNKEEIKN